MPEDGEVAFDLDAVRAQAMEANPVAYRTMKYQDREWKIRPEPNVMALVDFADKGGKSGQLSLLLSYIHADEREDFKLALASDEALDGAVFEALLGYLMNATTGRPTTPSSSSEDGSSTTGDTSRDDSSTTAVPVG